MEKIENKIVEVTCGTCNAKIKVRLKQVANEERIKCKCGQKIQLIDTRNVAKNTIIKVNAANKKLFKAIKKL